MNFTHQTFNVLPEFLSALINDDFSELTKSEDLRVSAFISNVRDQYGIGHFDFDPLEIAKFTECDIIGARGTCVTIKYSTPIRK